MANWIVDTPVHNPGEEPEDTVGTGRVPGDWHACLKRVPGPYMLLQFGSIGVTKSEADRIVEAMVAGLNEMESSKVDA